MLDRVLANEFEEKVRGHIAKLDRALENHFVLCRPHSCFDISVLMDLRYDLEQMLEEEKNG